MSRNLALSGLLVLVAVYLAADYSVDTPRPAEARAAASTDFVPASFRFAKASDDRPAAEVAAPIGLTASDGTGLALVALEANGVLEPPLAIHAVRGPLTRSALLAQGIECAEVYGDPALLLPRFFNPRVEKKYDIGIVPHYADKGHPWVERNRQRPNVRVIDIESGIEEFVGAVLSCETILSSSLHGLICADAYGLPAAWIRLSNRLDGGSFKFRDYRLSIGAESPVPTEIDQGTPLTEASRDAALTHLRIDLRRLLLSFPLLRSDLRKEVETASATSCGLPESFAAARLSDVTGTT